MKAHNTDVFATATNESELNNISFENEELSDTDLMAINGGAATPLGSGLGQVGDGLSTILNPVVGGLLTLVGG